MSEITPQHRLDAAAHLHESDRKAIDWTLKCLASEVELLTVRRDLSQLRTVQSTLDELRRRMTRAEAWVEILP